MDRIDRLWGGVSSCDCDSSSPSGWMSTAASVYIAEASPASLRGRLVTFQSVLITLGRFCGAMASAVAFSLDPPVTGRKQPVLMMTTDLLTATKAHRQPAFKLQWLDVLNFSSRRSVSHFSASIDVSSCRVRLQLMFSPSALLPTSRTHGPAHHLCASS